MQGASTPPPEGQDAARTKGEMLVVVQLHDTVLPAPPDFVRRATREAASPRSPSASSPLEERLRLAAERREVRIQGAGAGAAVRGKARQGMRGAAAQPQCGGPCAGLAVCARLPAVAQGQHAPGLVRGAARLVTWPPKRASFHAAPLA